MDISARTNHRPVPRAPQSPTIRGAECVVPSTPSSHLGQLRLHHRSLSGREACELRLLRRMSAVHVQYLCSRDLPGLL
jgi:hypothetical protein